MGLARRVAPIESSRPTAIPDASPTAESLAGAAPAGGELPVAEMHRVTMRWGDKKPVLDGVDLNLWAGERLMVVGPSGAGNQFDSLVLPGDSFWM